MAFLCSPEPAATTGTSGYFLRDRGKRLGPFAFILLLVLVFVRPGMPQATSPPATGNPHTLENKRVEVKIIARGSSTVSSTGNMDVYLAVISSGRHAEPVAARLVYYYPFVAVGLSRKQMNSNQPFHLRLSYAAYCEMKARDFAPQQVFDEDALSKLRGEDTQAPLPCYVIRE